MSQVWHNSNSQPNDVATSNDAAASNERSDKEPPLQGRQPSFPGQQQQQQRITLPSLSALNANDEDRRDYNGAQPLASHATHILGYSPVHSNIIPSISTDSALKQSHEYHPHPKSSSSSPSLKTAVVDTAPATTLAPALAPLPTAGGASFSLSRFDNPLPINTSVCTKDSKSYNGVQEEEKANQQQIQDQRPAAHSANASEPSSNYVDTSYSVNNENSNDEDPDYRPLNVKDALSYLEQVKFQFSSRPDIYNLFLDIMKDFKSQAIDTPGVIERVSTLFRGYPILIQGFNTFLPQGYRIECSTNPDDPIRVTTPMGTTTVNNNVSPSGRGTVDGQEPSSLSEPDGNAIQPFHNLPMVPSNVYRSEQSQDQKQSLPLSANSVGLSSIHPPEIPPHHQILQGQSLPVQEDAKKNVDVEFSQAISYVNKIKTRFADQPDIYKHFLEILQTYQREQKPINEVYAQVTHLFQNAPDLLEDFKKFLPDSSASANQQVQHAQQHAQQQQEAQMHAQTQAQAQVQAHAQAEVEQQQQKHQQKQQPQFLYPASSYYNHSTNRGVPQQNLPPIGSFSPPTNGSTVHDNYQDQQHMQPPHLVPLPSMVQHGPNMVHQGIANENLPISDLRTSLTDQYAPSTFQQQQQNPPSISPITDLQYGDVPVRPEIDLDPSIVPVVPEPTEPIEDNISLNEEVTFFEKAKRYIGNKHLYTEFLKILNLYSQDILDLDDLVEKVDFYLGSNKELFSWFKNFVGYQEKTKCIENIVHEKHRLDLDLCEAFGPSYKRLPKSDTFMPCSGRDDMCWEILNDEWVGHPVWASEDSGFIAHRKNQYEETLFKIEEERHEYDFYIESNLRTIQCLETIVNKIENMTESEKSDFKLPPGLGHTSMTIYKKVIRKVYDKERGFEIIDALHEHPAVTAPVVLKRLKQKDEEWRRAQREWNKVWRELEQKVFFKSLDHLGLTFKQADKKLLTTKQLISEINSIKVDQTNKKIHWLTPKPKSQLDFDFPDKDIFYDILYLADSFISHTTAYSNPDKERLKDLLKYFISLFFSIPLEKIEKALQFHKENVSESSGSDDGGSSTSRKRPYQQEMSLLDILHRNRYQKLKRSNDEEGKIPQLSEPLDEESNTIEEEELISEEARNPWLTGNLVEEANSQGIIQNRSIFNLFANTNIYIFFRHWTTIYERLLEIKQMNGKITKEVNTRSTVTFAKDLDLLSNQLPEMGLDFIGEDAYKQVLRLSRRLINGDLEHQWFEESLRQAYNNKAFKLYTIDKVTQSLVKHAHTLMADVKTAEIMALFVKDRNAFTTSAKDQIIYRLQVRSYMSNIENMFRIELNKRSLHVSVQYIALDDLTLKEPKADEDKWKYYVTSYGLPHPTEGISHEKLKIPFLERLIEFGQDTDGREVDEEFSPEGISLSTLRIKIQPITYKLHIENGSYDVFTRKAVNKYPTIANDDVHKEMVVQKTALISRFLENAIRSRNDLNEATKSGMQEKLALLKGVTAKVNDENEVKELKTEEDLAAKQEQPKNLPTSDANVITSSISNAPQYGNAEAGESPGPSEKETKIQY
ncbi:transcriptional regulator SIN3 SKDI_15G1520 [Saccharomyces kudriavzevii IFO 1802]|uniref:Histone deacetylase interacting domain-containing protein n=1 Tax=Saccharomyces kudriavzevii (strain ATCC MYA-4449 / AS 2.2408 / CBS 8840 / NBRC 1802 / NCYC 2889) TaxID=226230 RepID=A0AA35J976_SACK1|nr:uncharacterized protein SKDI_15G1520 [Saccharomyces kudriavzevii IFO 1802]CAI4051153.1 hypothetical protein SKDI_15G1520 [Saccharomyces kudriavzevii IFO 1802]